MLRSVLGLAVITTMVVLSPEREKSPGNVPVTALQDGGSLAEAAGRLAPGLIGSAATATGPNILSAQVAAGAGPIARQIAASSMEPVRRIAISPAPIPLDMPPLRHGRD